jgi:hypothetical protein
MDEVAVDIEQAGPVVLAVDDMVLENLVVECGRGFGRSHGLRAFGTEIELGGRAGRGA